MTDAPTPAELLENDALPEALALAQERVKLKPGDRDARNLYIDLLILSGDFARADTQCNLASTFSPEDVVGFGMMRRQLRGIAAREAWFAEAAVPAFPGGPSELDQLAIRIGIALQSGDGAETRALIEELDERRGEQPMVWNGNPVGDIRDLDDRIPHALEVLTNGGAYLWIDYAKIAALSLAPMRRPRDLAFREAELSLLDGSSATVLIPALYPARKDDTPSLRLGRETDFSEAPGGLTIGHGQRCLLAGDDAMPFHELTSLACADAKAAAGGGRKAANG
ncbi:type VI secretion system accessory protein TagJ [Rhizobium halophytocola]|uniref:Type VI secretion system protein ImpE n=1 Tax=Rhizobium halophytocola TaxID=735519 RepID=A0ABS4E673_9HYPH|nr:type VI secretion system accessory protein TagJ [Rhizobium halophytocola]MBP1853447.1 type VI secretion system protein ImpE [Rhizobium halophytocola]